MTAPYVIPVTSAPAQLVTANLGGQNVLLNIYTKSLNVPNQPGPAFPSNRLAGIAYGASLSGDTMTVPNPVVGLFAKGYLITGTGLAAHSSITGLALGTAGSTGTYYIYPAATTTASTRITAYVTTLNPGNNPILVDPPPYVNTNPVFVDVYLNDALLIGGVILRNKNKVVRNSYLGFTGDIVVIDTVGDEDPVGVPPTLPPESLRNQDQRDLPLSLNGKAPAATAGTIPGLGSRYLLVWWPSA